MSSIIYNEISSPEEEQLIKEWCAKHNANVDEFGHSPFISIDQTTFEPYVKINNKNYKLLPIRKE